MLADAHEETADLIKAVRKQLSAHKNKRMTAQTSEELGLFAEALFRRGALEDLTKLSTDNLATMTTALFAFGQKRKLGAPKIQIHNPDYADATAIDVVNDNMAFLVGSVMDLLHERGFHIHLVLHPIVVVARDKTGKRTAFLGEGAAAAADELRESVIHIQIDRIDDLKAREALQEDIVRVLQDVDVVNDDWQPMRARLAAAVANFKDNPPPIPVDELAEAIQFLEWLLENNFTFLGMREYAFSGGRKAEMSRLEETGLGILRDPKVHVLKRGGQFLAITPEIRQFLLQPAPLIITKANVRSNVHRRVHMDYIGIKLFGADGRLTAELRIVGLFTSTAYTKSAQTIPYLRRKVDQVVRQAGLDPESHSGKALLNVLESYPRDELFQIDIDTLSRFATAIRMLDERPRIRVLARRDKFDRFVSALVYVPRDRFSTDVRVTIGDYLRTVFDGRLSAYYPFYGESTLVRIHYIIGRDAGETPDPDQEDLEAAVTRIVRTWDDALRDALAATGEPARATALFGAYASGFTAAYKEAFDADTAVGDIDVLDRLSEKRRLGLKFRQRDEENGVLDLKIYHFGRPIPLSDRMPIIENMGFRAINERTYRVKPRGDENARTWIHDVALAPISGAAVDLAELAPRLEATVHAIWAGNAEDDGYNALVLNAGIPWRDVAILRALSRYLRQTGLPYSQDYMWRTLNRHSEIAWKLVDYFHARFNPHAADLADDMRETREAGLAAEIDDALQAVESLDEDRIIRRFKNGIEAILRTNFFQVGGDGQIKPTIAFKLDPHRIEGLPLPRPYREIFVYSPRVEGVHLRFGPVARGGLRWSDRPQDFRTEVLGLVKAQQVKNAVIVPVGAKGGFVPKHLPVGGSRDEVFTEGRESYKVFISSLLDVTDNLDGIDVLPPENVVRKDDDDPYLVVAADKGTATFSDTANAISEDRDFWLGDAFASGGSAGYDHKKMGITARGGWEAVKRHFREMDIDIQTMPFTVIGVGDMSGDVFGNGMLLSDQIRLQAAFDHRDIFIDPDPDPAKSFKERKRLFELGRSSWQDYNPKLLSKGGQIYSRATKALALTPEIQKFLGISKSRVSPFELINAILKAKADLLWFGGIGTYVRAATETDAEAGDRANDAVRVTADALNVKVVGEGANLGMTQKARIAFALQGGRVNSDAIDNSAGVNSSDLEVNIKIALGAAVRAGKLKTPARNTLLAKMTDEVAALVLRNNYLQTLALSLAERRGLAEFEFQARFMADLEGRDLLDRQVEDLPDPTALQERIEDGVPLSRPELAVLLAYAKLTLFDELLATSVPDEPYLARELGRYFPTQMQPRYTPEINNHRLKREIIATMLANSMINRGGPVFVPRMVDQTGAGIADVAAGFALARDAYQMTDLNAAIDALDTKISGDLQLSLYSRVQDLLWQQTPWFLRHADPAAGLSDQVARFKKGLAALEKALDKALPESTATARAAERERLAGDGVPADLARHMANLPYLAAGPDIIMVSERSGATIAAAASAYFVAGDRFGTDRLIRAATAMGLSDYFDRMAMNRALDGVFEAQRRIAETALSGANGKGDAAISGWLEAAGDKAERARRSVAQIADDPALTVSKLSVASALLRDLAPA